MSTTLSLHAGARPAERGELALVPVPRATKSWHPVGHDKVIGAVEECLSGAGFAIRHARYGLSKDDARMFATLDLTSPLAPGVSLAVGVRNSMDKSLPLGFCAGSRVFVCDNLAFSSELLVRRKHTVNGNIRFHEAIALAVHGLNQFKTQEAARINRFRELTLTEDRACGVILKSFEDGIIGHRLLKPVLNGWHAPVQDEFKPRTAWSLFNSFTDALRDKALSQPQQHADATIHLTRLLDPLTAAAA